MAYKQVSIKQDTYLILKSLAASSGKTIPECLTDSINLLYLLEGVDYLGGDIAIKFKDGDIFNFCDHHDLIKIFNKIHEITERGAQD